MLKRLLRATLPALNKYAQLDPWNDALWTDSTTGLAVASSNAITAESAMKESTLFACVRLLSDSVAQLPCKLFSETSDGINPLMDDSLYRVLLHSPNSWLTAFDYWKFNVVGLATRGFFVSRIIRNGSGQVVALIPLHPNYTTIAVSADGSLTFKGPTVIDVANKNFKRVQTVKRADAFYAYYATFDGIRPVSPIGYNKATIGLGLEMREHANELFKNEAMPAGVLQTPETLTDKAYDRLKRGWKSAQGKGQRGSPAILEEGMTWNKTSLSNEDAQYLETRQYTKEEICGIYGVPSHMISDTKQAKGWSTLEAMMQEFLTLHLDPWLTRIEKAITFCLIAPEKWDNEYANFQTNKFLRADVKTRTEFYKALFEMSGLSPNEIRTIEDLNPIGPDGDTYYVSQNVKSSQKRDAAPAKELAEIIQKIYLGVANGVISVDEAREIANREGAGLPVPFQTAE